MACTSPVTGWRARHPSANGKRPLVFNPNDGYKDREVTVPCGRCTSCRLEYSRQWAVRCVHEAQMHQDNCFITLTYSPEHIPDDYSLHKDHLQKFFKRLRKNIDQKVRYFACGEYGEKNQRPHYHAILFGYNFPDRELWSKTKNGDLLHRSRLLEKTWPYGFSTIGEMTFETAAYVARYTMKKRRGDPEYEDPKTGKTNAEHYMVVDPDTGEVYKITPEFCLMSRRPGIGLPWLERYKQDTNKDFITINGNKMSLPRYYDQKLAELDERAMVKRKAKRRSKIDPEEQLEERLIQKRKVVEARSKQLTRQLEKYG